MSHRVVIAPGRSGEQRVTRYRTTDNPGNELSSPSGPVVTNARLEHDAVALLASLDRTQQSCTSRVLEHLAHTLSTLG